MACWVTLEELKPLLDHIGADGVHLEMDFHNEREVEQAMRIIEEYTGSSSSVSADVHTNQPVGEQDNAQEVFGSEKKVSGRGSDETFV